MNPQGFTTTGLIRQTGRLLWQLGPFNAMDINPPFHSTTMSKDKISGNFFAHLSGGGRVVRRYWVNFHRGALRERPMCFNKHGNMSFLFDIQVENDRPNTDVILRTGERIKTLLDRVYFIIFLPGVGFIPCLNHITCKRHSRYLFLYRGCAWGVRAIIMGWGVAGRFIHLYEKVYVLYK